MDRIPIFPLDVVLFPGELFGLHVFEERYLLMVEEVLAEDLPIGIVLARQDEPEDRIEHDPEAVGTAAIVIQTEKVEDRYLLQTVGTRRFRILEVLSEKPYQEALVEWLDEDPGDAEEAARLANELLDRVEQMGGTVDRSTEGIDDPVAVSHAVAHSCDARQIGRQSENSPRRVRPRGLPGGRGDGQNETHR
ncbi:MAG TPA: LON peptidase substrate-binding domain-containing protein, partial [Candidatus Thermoplasmatota archaeon]|nr:LON peptidase substrate-binding domain-containing protein [Candidatus Thermoplasmatota archaeon]